MAVEAAAGDLGVSRRPFVDIADATDSGISAEQERLSASSPHPRCLLAACIRISSGLVIFLVVMDDRSSHP